MTYIKQEKTSTQVLVNESAQPQVGVKEFRLQLYCLPASPKVHTHTHKAACKFKRYFKVLPSVVLSLNLGRAAICTLCGVKLKFKAVKEKKV